MYLMMQLYMHMSTLTTELRCIKYCKIISWNETKNHVLHNFSWPEMFTHGTLTEITIYIHVVLLLTMTKSISQKVDIFSQSPEQFHCLSNYIYGP